MGGGDGGAAAVMVMPFYYRVAPRAIIPQVHLPGRRFLAPFGRFGSWLFIIMRKLVVLALTAAVTALSACGIAKPADGGDGGTSASDAQVADGGPLTPTGTMGASCGVDMSTGITLCRAISLCPTLTIDPDVFPDCGFRVTSADIIDIQCACNGALCPMGTATKCADVVALMQSQSQLSVCSQVSEGRCSGGVTTPAPTTTGTGTGTCDPQCRAMCAGDPSCFTLCGC